MAAIQSGILLALALSTKLAGTASGFESALTITIRVENSAMLDSRTSRSAEEEARYVLQQAGIELVWRDCSPGSPDWAANACSRPLAANDFWLHISNWKPAGIPDASLGFTALKAGSGPSDAWVHYPSVARMSARCDVDEAVVLAAALAHEIGHLLGAGHSSGGVMSAKFDRRHVVDMGQGRLLFTPDQAVQIRREIIQRRRISGPL